MHSPSRSILLTCCILAFVGAGCFPSSKPPTKPIACTKEAKLCPDGSAVGRTGPNCEFAPCPPSPSTCKDQCGNGSCDEIVCMAIGCPCAETAASCPQDCGDRSKPTTMKMPEGCPDICEAVCSGKPEPPVPQGCPMPMCYCPQQTQ